MTSRKSLLRFAYGISWLGVCTVRGSQACELPAAACLPACLPVGFQFYTSLYSLDSPLVAHIMHAPQPSNIQVKIDVGSAGNTVGAYVTTSDSRTTGRTENCAEVAAFERRCKELEAQLAERELTIDALRAELNAANAKIPNKVTVPDFVYIGKSKNVTCFPSIKGCGGLRSPNELMPGPNCFQCK